MTFYTETYSSLTLILSYLLIYNLSLFLLFSTIFQLNLNKKKSLISLSDLGRNSFYTKVLIVLVFSMAGVPPLWGFFAKLFIFVLLLDTNFSLFFLFFLILLIIGLYFYVQNIRFLNTTSPSSPLPVLITRLELSTHYGPFSLVILFLLIFGSFFTEDLMIFTTWIFF